MKKNLAKGDLEPCTKFGQSKNSAKHPDDLPLFAFSSIQVTESDFVCVYSNDCHPRWGLSEFHCYAKEVKEEEYKEIEAQAMKAREFGHEVGF